ncbi:MAG: hypothetical protein JO147_09125 [Actinobacteria bacterium]|nr:hypothetical protein [Actinomycetota bacterium]
MTALLALSHYWCGYALAPTAAALLARVVLDRERHRILRLLVAMAVGAVSRSFWLPTFLFQLRHTGTPRARPPSLSAVATSIRGCGNWASGITTGEYAFPGFLALGLAAIVSVRRAPQRAMPRKPLVHGRWIGADTLATLTLGTLGSMIARSGFAERYTTPAFALAVLLFNRCPAPARRDRIAPRPVRPPGFSSVASGRPTPLSTARISSAGGVAAPTEQCHAIRVSHARPG